MHNVLIIKKKVDIKSVRIGDIVMQVYPAENPELVPEIQGPFYDGSQVLFIIIAGIYHD